MAGAALALSVRAGVGTADAPVSRSRWVVPLVCAHGLVMFVFCALRHRNYGSHAFDLGAYHQVFWNLAHHGSLYSSVERMHQWSAHLEVGLLPLWLPYRVAPSVHWLLLLQSAAAAAAALPVEALARRAIGDRALSLVVAAAFLLTPQLLFAEIYDFHSLTLCVLPVAVLVWALHADRVRWVVGAALLALSLREQMGLCVLMAGACWPLLHGQRRLVAGLLLAGLGVGVFLAEVLWLIPSFGDGARFQYLGHYGRLGQSAPEALRFALHHPLRLVLLAFEGQRPWYLVKLVAGAAPLLLIGLRWPRACWPLLLGVPLVAVQLLADREEIWSVRFHYGAPLVPVIAAAAALCAAQLAGHRRAFALVLCCAWLLLNGAYTALRVAPYAVLPGGPLQPPAPERARALERAFQLLPPEGCVSAQDQLVPHIAARVCVHQWPDGEAEDAFVLLDENVEPHNEHPEPVADAARRLRTDARFEVRVDEAGVLLLQRRYPLPRRTRRGEGKGARRSANHSSRPV